MTARWSHGRDLPAYTSWPVPTITREQETARLCALNVTLPADEQVPDYVNEQLTAPWASYRLRLFHGGRCAICGGRYLKRRLDLDHDYRTGLVRGHLCRSCNTYEGRNPRAEGPWAAYRATPPAAVVGVRVYYVGFDWADGWWRDLDRARRLTGNPEWAPIEGAER